MKATFFRKVKRLIANRKYTQHFVEHVPYIISEHNKYFSIDYIYAF